MGEAPWTFTPSFNASVVIEARPERPTSNAGAVIVRDAAERTPSAGTAPRRRFPPFKATGKRRFEPGCTPAASDRSP